jgi:uncharacterized protein
MKKLECFVDTSAFIALYNTRDQHHQEAVRISEKLDGYTFYISDAILTETHTILRYRIGFHAARHFLLQALNDDDFVLLPVDQNIRKKTFEILTTFSDHKISFCDALTAALMKANDMTEIFAFDSHFEVMGVNRLYADS